MTQDPRKVEQEAARLLGNLHVARKRAARAAKMILDGMAPPPGEGGLTYEKLLEAAREARGTGVGLAAEGRELEAWLQPQLPGLGPEAPE